MGATGVPNGDEGCEFGDAKSTFGVIRVTKWGFSTYGRKTSGESSTVYHPVMENDQQHPQDEKPVTESQMDQGMTGLRLNINESYLPIPIANGERVFRKSVQAIHSYPSSPDVSVTARKLINAICIYAQDCFSATTEDHRRQIKDPAIRATPIFRTSIGDLKKMIKQSSNDVERIYEALRNIFNWTFTYNVMGDVYGESKIVARHQSRMISDLGIGTADGLNAGEITFEIPNAVLLMIVEPFPYTQISMRIENGMRSGATIALFENTYRYISTENKVTAIMDVRDWINMIAGEGKYPGGDGYKFFKRLVLKPAMHQIETLDTVPYSLELIEKKGPRNRIIALQFKLHLKKQSGLNMETPISWHPSTAETLKNVYKLSAAKIAELPTFASEDEIVEAIRRESVMYANKLRLNDPILDRATYLMGIVRNVQTGRPKLEEPAPEDDSLEEIGEGERLRALERVRKLRESFKSHQVSTIKKGIAMLPQDSIEALRERFRNSPKGSTESIKKMEQKGWGAGLNAIFAGWASEEPDLRERFLTRDEDKEFDIWREIQAQG